MRNYFQGFFYYCLIGYLALFKLVTSEKICDTHTRGCISLRKPGQGLLILTPLIKKEGGCLLKQAVLSLTMHRRVKCIYSCSFSWSEGINVKPQAARFLQLPGSGADALASGLCGNPGTFPFASGKFCESCDLQIGCEEVEP